MILGIDGLAVDAMLECTSLQVLHGDEGLAFIFANVVDRTNIWLIECRGRARFALKTFESLRIVSELLGKEFQGDGPAEPCVLRFIDDPHTAAAELFPNAIVGDGLPDK
jgi:hypothetical protein